MGGFLVKSCLSLSGSELNEMQTKTSTTRQCKSCKRSKPVKEFHSSGDGKTQRWVCKDCRNTKNQEYYQDKTRSRNLLRQYGITLSEYDELLTQQGGVCAICGDSPAGSRRRFDVDHHHETGQIRGILCGRCNIALGGFRDSLDLLISASCYLLASETD